MMSLLFLPQHMWLHLAMMASTESSAMFSAIPQCLKGVLGDFIAHYCCLFDQLKAT